VLADELQDPLLHRGPDRGALLGPGGRTGHFTGGGAELGQVGDGDLHLDLDLFRVRRLDHPHRATAGQERLDFFHRSHGGGEPDALGRFRQQLVQALQRQRQVRAAFRTGQRVHFVQDHGFDPAERFPRGRGEQQEQRLGCGDQHVRWGPGERAALFGGGVAGADPDADVGWWFAAAPGDLPDAREGGAQVALHVDRQGFQRGHVEHSAALLRIGGRAFGGQPVERVQEGGQGLAGSGGGHHQGVLTGRDGRPGLPLGPGGVGERFLEPLPGHR
jgi:hypothetical protein